MTTPTPDTMETVVIQPIPDSGGRWARDPKTGALTKLPDDDEAEGEDASVRKPSAKAETPKPAAKADDPVKGA